MIFEKLARISIRQEQSVSKRLQYVWTTRPTHCPLCVALSFGDTATLRTAQATLSVSKIEHVYHEDCMTKLS